MSNVKIEVFKNGAYASFEKLFPSGMYLVQAKQPSGTVIDRMRCDTYSDAMAYWKAFKAVAKQS